MTTEALTAAAAPGRRARWSWAAHERALMVLFLATRFYALYQRWNIAYGHDGYAQMEMTNFLTWNKLLPDIKECFHCVHPLLGFLIPKTFQLMGFSDLHSAILASFVSSLIAFFLLRAVVFHLKVLHRPWGIAFLYITVSIPVQLYLATAITLDGMLYGMATAILYLSIRLFVAPPGLRVMRVLVGVGLVVAMAAAALTKFSGLVLFAIPVFVALVQQRRRQEHVWLRRLVLSGVLGAVAVGAVFPYYYVRYYKVTGHFFPMNQEWLRGDDMVKARQWVDEDPVRFFLELFSPSPDAREHPDRNDPKIARLHDTWRFFWVQSHVLGWRADSYWISVFYVRHVNWLLALGAWLLFVRRKRRRPWVRFGAATLLVALTQWAALIQYNYAQPYPLWITVKAIYISPFVWTLGYLLSCVMWARRWAPAWIVARNGWRATQQVMLAGIAVFIFLNHWYLIY